MAMSEVMSYEDMKGSSSERKPIEHQEEVKESSAEPIKAEIAEEPAHEEVKSEPVKPSFEEEARAKGWKPKEEFEGDPDDWTPAKSWLKTGEILDSFISLALRQLKSILILILSVLFVIVSFIFYIMFSLRNGVSF